MTAVIEINYPKWKTIADDTALPIRHVDQRGEGFYVFTGKEGRVFKSYAANGANKTDFDSNYLGRSQLETLSEDAILDVSSAPLSVQVIATEASAEVDGIIAGQSLRYEKESTKVDLPNSSNTAATVYEITEASVFYKYAFQVNSDNIFVQVEIDGQDIFPGDGIDLEDLEDLDLGYQGGSYGGQVGGTGFGFYQHASNKWCWEPPAPLRVNSNMKVKMKANSSSTKRDFNFGLAVRRVGS